MILICNPITGFQYAITAILWHALWLVVFTINLHNPTVLLRFKWYLRNNIRYYIEHDKYENAPADRAVTKKNPSLKQMRGFGGEN